MTKEAVLYVSNQCEVCAEILKNNKTRKFRIVTIEEDPAGSRDITAVPMLEIGGKRYFGDEAVLAMAFVGYDPELEDEIPF